MSINTSKLLLAYQKIKEANNILLITHLRPDADALASLAIMVEVCQMEEKFFSTYCHEFVPGAMDFIPHTELINTSIPDISKFDLIITLDCGSLSRTNLNKELLSISKNQFIIEFDHHPKIDNYANLEIRYETASTTELLYYFIKENKININKNIANCILTGIISDTGNFLYPSTTEKTITIASQMMKYGASLPKIVKNTWQNKTVAEMKLWGKTIDNLKVNDTYKIAYTVIDAKLEKEIPKESQIINDIVDFLGNLADVKAVMILRQDKEDSIKGSFRTNQADVDVSHLAKILGGGGHSKASGFTINGKLEQTDTGWLIK